MSLQGQDVAFEPAKLLWLIQRDFLRKYTKNISHNWLFITVTSQLPFTKILFGSRVSLWYCHFPCFNYLFFCNLWCEAQCWPFQKESLYSKWSTSLSDESLMPMVSFLSLHIVFDTYTVWVWLTRKLIMRLVSSRGQEYWSGIFNFSSPKLLLVCYAKHHIIVIISMLSITYYEPFRWIRSANHWPSWVTIALPLAYLRFVFIFF